MESRPGKEKRVSYATRAEVRGKVEWEGGIMEALDYGIHAIDMPVGDEELIAAWTALENAHEALRPLAEAVERLLEAAPDDEGQPS